MLHLRICVSGEANDVCTNHMFASSFVASFASPFVALVLEAVFQTRVKGDEWRFALCVHSCECSYACEISFFHTDTQVYECLCKWRGEAWARMCKCGITLFILPKITRNRKIIHLRRFPNYAKQFIFSLKIRFLLLCDYKH